MCIALITTSHPQYPFILAANRDEYLSRPTLNAAWWDDPNPHVLGGRDLQRDIRGTWLGITKQGRIAVLTNFREEGADYSGLKSRGGIVNEYLTTAPDSTERTADFARRLVDEVGVSDVGGFSLVFGRLRRHDTGLAILSNRTSDAEDMVWVADQPDSTHGLSNSHYGDLSWPKVVHGEQLMKQLVHSHLLRKAGRDDLIEHLFDMLKLDTLPKKPIGEDFQTFVRQLRNSIFIPRLGGEVDGERQPADKLAAADSERPTNTGQGIYATQKQTVVLVDTEGHVTFSERTVFDEHGKDIPEAAGTRSFEFDIEGWES